MAKKIVVIGGTGRIGSKVVALLRGHGHDVVAASPQTGVNAVTGEGLDAVLQGADVVVDVANSPSFDEKPVMDFFRSSTQHLVAAARKAGVGHYTALSVVGTDRMQDVPYFRAKLVQEQMIQSASIPYSIVRATQFFEFVAAIADTATEGGVVRVPPVFFQPMAAEDVARAVARAAAGQPVNGIADVAGPDRFLMDELIRSFLSFRKDPRTVVTDPEAGYFGGRMGMDTLVPTGAAQLGQIHFEDWSSPAAAGA